MSLSGVLPICISALKGWWNEEVVLSFFMNDACFWCFLTASLLLQPLFVFAMTFDTIRDCRSVVWCLAFWCYLHQCGWWAKVVMIEDSRVLYECYFAGKGCLCNVKNYFCTMPAPVTGALIFDHSYLAGLSEWCCVVLNGCGSLSVLVRNLGCILCHLYPACQLSKQCIYTSAFTLK